MDKIAIIDCGTNTFHLLIVLYDDAEIKVIHKEKVSVRIGKGGISKNLMLPGAIHRAADTIAHFAEVIKRIHVDRTYAFATSAFRNAENGITVQKEIQHRTGIDIKIISGLKEAELIFWGVNWALDIGIKPALVMDIGGGSVEFIIGSKDNIQWKESFEIGAQRLLDMFHQNDPIQEQELRQLEDYLDQKLQPLLAQIKKHQPEILIGSSGTFDTLSDIYFEERAITRDEQATELSLPIDDYKKIHSELLGKNREERMQIPGMIEMRVDMIVVASALINFLLHKHPFSTIKVSTYALKEGVLNRIMHGEL